MKSENKKAISKGITAILAISIIVAISMSGTVYADPGTTYYVNAATGNDANTPAQAQNPATPWKTITHAVNTVPAGASFADQNIIQVAAGLYDATINGETFAITFDNANIRLSGAGAATTTIDGEGTGTILDINATGITVEMFNITNATNNGIYADVGEFIILDNLFCNVSDGVHLYISETNLATDYTVDDILIDGNTFNISDYGVYVDIELDYDDTKTGLTATIGDIDILDNIFNMGTTDGIDIDDIYVDDLNDGSISVGNVNMLRNEFYDGSYGIDFFGYFDDLTNTTVTVGDVVINDNTFENQTSEAIYIDYYDADYWYGTTTGTFGDLVINGNTITSVTTDAIYISDLGYWEDFEDEAALTVGNLYIEDNEINVSGYGIYVDYYDIEELYNDASVTIGEVSIKGNIIDAGDEAIYIYYEDVACYMYNSATLLMGDTYIQDNQVTSYSDGVYIEYYDYYVGSYNEDDAYAELPSYIITGNTFDVDGDGIYFYTYSNPDDTYDYALTDFGGFFIDDNTFSCDHGIYFYIEDVCEDCDDSSGAIFRDTTISNNEFYQLDDEAIYIYYDDVGYSFDDDGMVEVGDLVIADNVIDGVGYGDGIDVEYWYIYSEYDATVTMGTLDITGNTISDVEDDGIDVDYYLDAEDNSTVSVGRALIQGNTIDDCGEAGIDIDMDIDSDPGAVVNLGNPVINGNSITNCEYGIYLEDIGQALGIEGKGYHSAKESINTLSHNDNEGKAVKEHGSAESKKVSSESRSAEERSKPEREEKQRHNAKEGVEGVNILRISNNGGQVCPATISNNEITDNEHGIWLYNSSYNKIVKNMIVNNTEWDTGVHLDEGSSYNEIHTNCFYNNTPQAMDNGMGNTWDGNYWSPPPGGPGDFTIPGTAGSEDHNPLTDCPLQPVPVPVPVPEFNVIGLLALIGILSVVLATTILRRRR